MKTIWQAIAVSMGLCAAFTPQTLLAQSLSGSSAEVLLIPSGRTDAGLINIFIDNDLDGMADEFETAHGLDPSNPLDTLEDPDADGLTNLLEFRNSTDPHNPDTDGDGTSDGSEVLLGTNPLDPASGGANVTLLSIRLIPSFGVLTLNSFPALSEATLQLRVEGSLSDGSQVDLTASSRGTTYTTSDPVVATVDSEGLVTARAPGSATVTATNRGVSATTNVVVNTFTPRTLGFVPIPGFANNVDVQSGFAYVAAGSAGLVVVDVANPSAPRIVASLDTPGNANDVRVSGNLVYVADGSSGLQVIDISDPTRPRTIASVDTPGNASDVVVKGNLAYVADGTTGLQIVDLTDPAFARIIGSIDTPGIAFGVDVHELRGLAVVADGFSLQVVDVRNPASPVLRGSVPIPGSSGFGAPPAVDVAVSGVFAFVAAGLGGIEVIDVRDPAAPRSIGFTNVFIDAQDVGLLGNLAFAAEDVFVNAVPIFDLRNLTLPPFVGALDFSRAPSFRDDNGTGIAVSGSLIFLTGDRFFLTQNGVSGNSALHIGQYTQFNDNGINPPIVRITAPPSGSSVLEGQQFNVTVDARDDVFVAAVELLLNGSIVRTFTVPPYQASLTAPLDVTQLTLGARATDLAGNVGLAGPVVLTVVEDTPPVITITSPPVGTTLFEGQSFLVSAEATDNVGVQRVDFVVNGAVQTDPTAPYSATFAVPLGIQTLTIQATATDTLGQASSALRSVGVIPDPPPTVVITSPGEGATVVEGSFITISADASDNTRVDSVVFRINGIDQPPDTTPPFSLQFLVPFSLTGLTLQATATDNFGQRTTSLARFVAVVADPRTTVIGRVVDPEAQPVAEAIVTVFNEFAARSDSDGRFAIPGVSTARGDIVAVATATVGGVQLIGRSNPIAPIIGNLTDVGTIVLARAQAVFEEDFGPCVLQGDDTFLFQSFPPAFRFPFMGTTYDGVFLGTNGYLTFTAGDRTFSEDVTLFLAGPPRIALFWDDLFPGIGGTSCVHVNPFSDRFVVTWNRVPEFFNSGMNTMQIILFVDGRIQFGYRDLTAQDALVGLSPGGNPEFVSVDFTRDAPLNTTGLIAILEQFFGAMNNPVDLADTFITFTPNAQAGYGVELVRAPATTVRGLVVDGTSAPVAGARVSLVGAPFSRLTATTGIDGSFSIEQVPATRGAIQARAQARAPDGSFLFGTSSPVEPVPLGITNVGTIAVVVVPLPLGVFEPNLGSNLQQGDDDFDLVTIPFIFPYFGTDQTQAFVGSNGYLTFGQGDATFSESVSRFLGPLARIAPFFDDLDPRVEPGDVFVNDQLPGRLVVTWNQVGEFPFFGSNTIQLTLFATGQIQFLYNGLTARDAIVGISPGGQPPFLQVDYSAQAPFSTTGPIAIFEQFFGPTNNPFDLDGHTVLFTPNASAGYNVTVLQPAPCVMGGPVLGTVLGSDGHPYAGMKVELACSCDVRYHVTTTTDAYGQFRIDEVPVGAIHAAAYHGETLVATATGLMQTPGQTLFLELTQPPDSAKP